MYVCWLYVIALISSVAIFQTPSSYPSIIIIYLTGGGGYFSQALFDTKQLNIYKYTGADL